MEKSLYETISELIGIQFEVDPLFEKADKNSNGVKSAKIESDITGDGGRVITVKYEMNTDHPFYRGVNTIEICDNNDGNFYVDCM